jgi:hypothetical protein
VGCVGHVGHRACGSYVKWVTCQVCGPVYMSCYGNSHGEVDWYVGDAGIFWVTSRWVMWVTGQVWGAASVCYGYSQGEVDWAVGDTGICWVTDS